MEKMIEEIKNVLVHTCRRIRTFNEDWMQDRYAEALYKAGYRKQVQGEWIYHEAVITDDGLISGYSCSVCNALVNENVFDTDEFHKNYCGNCGAKMKGN